MATQQAQPERATAAPPAPFERILCAVDGSRCGREAIAQAITLAGADGELTFLTVSDARGFGPNRMATLGPHHVDEVLEEARRMARAAGVAATEIVRHGDDPRAVILEQARAYDLLVLGTHGRHRTAGFLLGSTPVAALHRSPVPVLIARRVRAGTKFPLDILLATDGSPAMAPTVAVTAALARRHQARVALLHVDHADHVARYEIAAEAAAIRSVTHREPVSLQLDGHAPSRIAEVALELPASLVITGSRLLTGVRALNSVSERTGVVAPCSVLVMRRAA
jgi:nucleotide-binding universal stress UspA family protein